MITESSFFTYKGDKGVAISRSVPRGWKGRKYPTLAPSVELLYVWRAGTIDREAYTEIYRASVLSRLDVEKVKKDLGPDAVLLCWERTGFCHRKLVIEWLNKKGEER